MNVSAFDYRLQEECARKKLARFDNIREGHAWNPVSWAGLASIQIAVDPHSAGALRFELKSAKSRHPGLPFGMWRKVSISEVDLVLERYLQSNTALIEEDLGQSLPFERFPDYLLHLLQTDLRNWSLTEYDEVIATLELCAAYAAVADRRA